MKFYMSSGKGNQDHLLPGRRRCHTGRHGAVRILRYLCHGPDIADSRIGSHKQIEGMSGRIKPTALFVKDLHNLRFQPSQGLRIPIVFLRRIELNPVIFLIFLADNAAKDQLGRESPVLSLQKVASDFSPHQYGSHRIDRPPGVKIRDPLHDKIHVSVRIPHV